jgi:AsmA-like C-terminal region
MMKRKWLRGALIAGVLLLGASVGFSRALRASAARRYLVAHLAASFGRPVDVSWFDFSLLDGARIEAHSVTVAEDPHFGNEYFLRADELTAGLRWTALLAGRFEFGSVSLLRPSLNLARDAEGHWNIERWLPPAPQPGSRPGFVGPVHAPSDVGAARLYRIDVDGGRINFKRQDDKSPFALVDVSGRVEEMGAGRWQLDLEARPMRAGVELQDIGTLRLRGSIAGTTARLQPADLNLTWRDASLADALRLVRQDDYGMRGGLAVNLNARIAPPETSLVQDAKSAGAQWSISGVARLVGFHGWRLPERDTDPAANLSVEASWRLGKPRAEIRKLVLEMPGSRLQGAGDLDWAHGFHPQLHIESSTLALGDILSWYRAQFPGVTDDLRMEGVLGVNLTLGGWPLQLQQGAISSVGGKLTSKSLPAPLRIGAMHASVSRGGLDFAPTEISIAATPAVTQRQELSPGRESANSFALRGSIVPSANGALRWPPDWNLSVEGTTSRVQDWLSLSAALAHPLNSGWTAAGGLAVKMRGVRSPESAAPAWLGTMDFLGLTWSPAYVNQPVRLSKAHVEFAPQQRTVTLLAAEALGAAWHGSIARKNSDPQWAFDLSADRLDAAELDRWLGPRARPGFLARLANFGSAAAVAPLSGSVVARLAAHGRLRAGEFDMAPLRVEQFDGEAELAGRTIRIRKAQAAFFGGKVAGSLDAQLLPDPSYDFQGRFDRVNLAQLGHAVTFLNNQIGGITSASLKLSAHGIGRRNLIDSLTGAGAIDARNVELRGFDFSAVFPGDDPDTAPGVFSSVQGTYQIRGRAIDLADLVLEQSQGRLQAEGRIGFSHALDLRIRPTVFQAATVPVSTLPPRFLLSGTIEHPKPLPPSPAPKAAARPVPRQR